jgi:hypothetical protein
METPYKLNNRSSRNLTPDKSVKAFMTSISDNRVALDLFKDQAQRRGYLAPPKPLIHTQTNYYQRFIAR